MMGEIIFVFATWLLIPPTPRLDLSGPAWAELVNSQPLNSALMFKVALLLGDKTNDVKDLFVHNLVLPKIFR